MKVGSLTSCLIGGFIALLLVGCAEKECDEACKAEEKSEQIERCKESRYDLLMARKRYASSDELNRVAKKTAIRCYGLTAEDIE